MENLILLVLMPMVFGPLLTMGLAMKALAYIMAHKQLLDAVVLALEIITVISQAVAGVVGAYFAVRKLFKGKDDSSDDDDEGSNGGPRHSARCPYK